MELNTVLNAFDSYLNAGFLSPEVQNTLTENFNNKDFCFQFLSEGKLISVIAKFYEKKKLINFNQIIPLIQTQSLIESFSSISIGEINEILQIIFLSDEKPDYTTIILHLIFNGIAEIYKTNPKIIDEISMSLQSFDQYIYKATPLAIIRLFDTLLHCSTEPISPAILLHLNVVFSNQDSSLETRMLILQKLYKEKIWENSKFQIENWYVPNICDEIESLNSFINIANQVMILDINKAKVIVQFLVLEVQPFPRDSVRVEEILHYLVSLINVTHLTADQFGDEKVIQCLIQEKPAFDVSLYIQCFESSQTLLGLMLDNKRRNWATSDLSERLVEMLEFDKDNGLANLYLPIFISDLSFNIVKALLKNIKIPSVQELTLTLMHSTDVMAKILAENDCFYGLPYEDDEFAKPFLTAMKNIMHISDQFIFDDWVVKQPASSNVFKISKDVLKQFTSTDPLKTITFPSLHFLVDDVCKDLLPSNAYLLGYYGLPVARKIGKSVYSYNNVRDIFSRFIRIFDITDCANSDLSIIVGLLRKNVEAELYEFTTEHSYAFATFKPQNSLVFSMQTYLDSKDPYSLFSINDVEFVMKDGILSVNGKELFDIPPKEWIQFGVFHSNNSINLYIDNNFVHTIQGKEIEIIIGSKKEKTVVPFFLNDCFASDITVEQYQQGNFQLTKNTHLTKSKGILFVPKHSFNDLMAEKESVQYIIDYFVSHDLDCEMCITFLSQIPECSTIENKWVFNKIINYFSKVIKKVKLSSLMLFVYCLVGRKDQVLLTEQLGNLIANIEIWNSCDVVLMRDFLKTIISSGVIKQVNYNKFFSIVYQTLFIVLTTDKFKEIESLVCKFIKEIVIGSTDSFVYETIKNYAITFGMMKGGANIPMYKYIVENMMIFFAEESETQGLLVEMCIDIEKKKDITIFTMSDIVYLSYILPARVAKKIFIPFILKSSSMTFIEENINIISLIFQKYAYDKEMWDCLASFAAGSECTLEAPKAIAVHFAMPIYIKMFKAVAKGNDDILLSQVIYLFQIYFAEFSPYLLKDPGFTFLYELITGDETFLTDIEIPLDSVDPDSIIDDARSSMYQRWLEKAQEYEKVISKSYVSVVSDFLLNFINMIKNNESHLITILQLIFLFSDKQIITYFMPRFIGTIWNWSDDSLIIVTQALSLLALSRPFEYKESKSTERIIERMEKTATKIEPFLPYFISISDTLTKDECIRVQIIFNIYYQNYNINDYKSFVEFIVQMSSKEDFLISFRLLENFKEAALQYKSSKPTFCNVVQTIESLDELCGLDLCCFKEDFMENADEIYSLAEATSERASRHNEQKIPVIRFLYTNAVYSARASTIRLRNMFHYINTHLRISEKEHVEYLIRVNTSHFQTPETQAELNSRTKSFFMSSCDVPCYFRGLVGRSPLPLPLPDESEVKKQENSGATLFSIVDLSDYSEPLPESFPNIYKYSFMVHGEADNPFDSFKELYNLDDDSCVNALFIHLDIRANCIFAKKKDEFIILIGAKLEDDHIEVCRVTNEVNNSLISNVISGEFGDCSMFLGKVVMHVKNISQIKKYSYLSSPFSYLVHSSNCGTFILDFKNNFELQELATNKAFNLNKKEILEKWENGTLSNFDFIFDINKLGFRSTSDLNSYPVFPRIITSIEADSYEGEAMRDLETPVQLCFNREQMIKKASRNYAMQKFHHPENLSNSTLVSALNFRLSPFCRSLWEINDGWDKGNRAFKQASLHLGIKQNVKFELIPDVYSIPEILMNMNKFEGFDLELPEWATNEVEFIVKIRDAMESDYVQHNIGKWISLVFGKKQAGQEAVESYNTFNPLSYHLQQSHNVVDGARRTWMENCGSVPIKVFNETVEKKKEIETKEPEISNVFVPKRRLMLGNDIFVTVNRCTCTINLTNNDGTIYCSYVDSKLKYFNDFSASLNKSYIAVTTTVSCVKVFSISYDLGTSKPIAISPISCITYPNIQFSVLSKKQMLCASAGDNVILWSTATSRILNIIEKKAIALAFDEEMGYVVIGCYDGIFIYTVNGTYVTEKRTESKVCSLKVLGTGFTQGKRFIACGFENGKIAVFGFKEHSLDIYEVVSMQVCLDPVQKIEEDGLVIHPAFVC